MKLSKLYQETLNEGNVWKQLESILNNSKTLLEGFGGGLDDLLKESNTVIFDKFNIKPNVKGIYFIAGSAALYLYPELIDEINALDKEHQMPKVAGDLDIVIPDAQVWVNAGLGEYAKIGIYRPYQLKPPTTNMNIEAFTIWEPSKAGGEYANVSVRTSSEILGDATLVGGYYFMSLQDVFEYKYKMGRDKEKAIRILIDKYNVEGANIPDNNYSFIKSIAQVITGKFAPRPQE
jgi:hypothetical protein